MRILSIDLDFIADTSIDENEKLVKEKLGDEEGLDMWPILKWQELFEKLPGQFSHEINTKNYQYCLRTYLRALRHCTDVRFGYDHDKISKFMSKSRSHISNTLRLLSLPEDIIGLIEEGKLTAGQARPLIGLPDPSTVAEEIVAVTPGEDVPLSALIASLRVFPLIRVPKLSFLTK